jgi:hypothetical protein
MAELSEQELHQLAMNIVGKELENDGFEFLAVNSKLKKNPQFVALKDKQLHFVVVRAITYPNSPKKYDTQLLEKVKNHAEKFEAITFYAGVGLANSKDYDQPLDSDSDYVVNYQGLTPIE